jgi:hypothetical protein
MGVLNLLQKLASVSREIKEERLMKEQEIARNFVKSLAPIEREEFLITLLISGSEYEGVEIDEFITDLRKEVLPRMRRGIQEGTKKQIQSNPSSLHKNFH